jgi:single-strand DNA-binding protein
MLWAWRSSFQFTEEPKIPFLNIEGIRITFRGVTGGKNMAGINKVILIGNLGADPETRYTQGGSAVTNFRIATSERWTSKDGQAQERTEWHRIVTFGRLAEHCRDYLSKGRQVFIEGRIQTRQWEDKDKNKRSTTEVVAQAVQFLGGGRGANNREEGAPVHPPSQDFESQNAGFGGSAGGGNFEGSPPISDDDVPF